nr:hypothetical protein [uncultured Acetatifactor sp.]
MKKTMLTTFLLTGCLLLTGCGSGEPADFATGDGGTAEGQDGTEQKDGDVLKYRIVDGAESGNLVLAGEGWGSVYTLSLGDDSKYKICLDGEEADKAMLEDGMMVEIVNAYIMETFPGQLGGELTIYAYSQGTEQNPGSEYYDLCGLYLQVLNDLWERDKGLNNNIKYVSVDLSQAPGELTNGEKSAVAWIFGCQHQVESLTMTQEELAEAGYLTELDLSSKNKLYQWEDGVLFQIKSAEWADGGIYSLPTIKFDANKWRGPKGACFFNDCIAVWPEMGTWSDYEIGGEAIS